MKSKASKKSTKSNQLNMKKPPSKINSKNPSKKPSKLNKDQISRTSKIAPSKKSKKLLSTGEQEIDAQSLPSNKSQISDLNILSKNSELTRTKIYEIKSDEQIPFLLNFEQVKDKIKITAVEKDSFPVNKYENFYSLEDFIKINKWFNIFYTIENLLSEFELLTKNENFAIEQKSRNVLSLFIVFPIDLLERIEIKLPINEINNLDLFSQLISKINEIESKENNDIAFFDEKIDNLSHLLQSIEEANKAREEEMLQNQNENENKENNDEENNKEENNNEEKNNHLEEMKDALKLQIEKKIKNNNIQQDNFNEMNNANIHHNNNEKDEEEKFDENNNEEQNENEHNIGFISPVENNNLLFAESSIISLDAPEKKKELNLLQNWLDGWKSQIGSLPSTSYTTKLIFSSEKEDDKASSFHKSCDNIAPTLILIETKEGFRYGGFTTQKWESPEQSIFKEDKNAFIFSLDMEKKYDVTDPEKSIQCSMFWGPYFGEGGAICVPDNFLQEKNAFYQWPSSYDISEKDELTFGQEHNINISKYEVYQIILENNGNNNEHEIDIEHNMEELKPRPDEEE
jgi:hypothetical protein